MYLSWSEQAEIDLQLPCARVLANLWARMVFGLLYICPLSCRAVALYGFHLPTGGEDYLAINGLVLEFEAGGDRRQVVQINITDDDLAEGPENFFGILSVVSGEGLVQFSQSTAEFIIIDNDSEYCHINWT